MNRMRPALTTRMPIKICVNIPENVERRTPNVQHRIQQGCLSRVPAIKAGDFARGLPIDRALLQISALVVRDFALTNAELGL